MEAQIELLQIFRKISLWNVLKILHINFHRASVTRNIVDDAPKLGSLFSYGVSIHFFGVKNAIFWEATVEAQIDFLEIFRKTPLGNVLKMLHINFHRASVTRNIVDDVPTLGNYFHMGFPFNFSA